MGEPWAYAIECQRGEEFSRLVYANQDEAVSALYARCNDIEDGEAEPELIPLYPREAEE